MVRLQLIEERLMLRALWIVPHLTNVGRESVMTRLPGNEADHFTVTRARASAGWTPELCEIRTNADDE
jgi:hypothetical protein